MLEDIIFSLSCNKLRHINLHVQKEIIILRLSVPLLIFLPISVPRPSQSQSTFFIITHLHIFQSLSCTFLLVADWWLSQSVSCRWFLPMWEIQSLRKHWQKCVIETPGTFGVPNRIFRNTGAEIFYPLNAELNPIYHLLALLGAHHILHVSGIRVKTHKTGTNGNSRVVSHRRGKIFLLFFCVLPYAGRGLIWDSSPAKKPQDALLIVIRDTSECVIDWNRGSCTLWVLYVVCAHSSTSE